MEETLRAFKNQFA